MQDGYKLLIGCQKRVLEHQSANRQQDPARYMKSSRWVTYAHQYQVHVIPLSTCHYKCIRNFLLDLEVEKLLCDNKLGLLSNLTIPREGEMPGCTHIRAYATTSKGVFCYIPHAMISCSNAVMHKEPEILWSFCYYWSDCQLHVTLLYTRSREPEKSHHRCYKNRTVMSQDEG